MIAPTDDLAVVQDSIADFGELALSTIRTLNQEVKQLQADLAKRDEQIAAMQAQLDRFVGRGR